VNELLNSNEEQQSVIETLEAKIRKKEQAKKLALLVRKPIYDEEKNSLGEAYVEELLTMRSDAKYDLFGEGVIGATYKGSRKSTQPNEINLSISKEEIADFKTQVESKGDAVPIDLEEVTDLSELQLRIESWFKSQDPKQPGFKLVVKHMQMMQQYFLKLKNTKNNIVNLQPDSTIHKRNSIKVGKASHRIDDSEGDEGSRRLSQKYNTIHSAHS
jgi:hypothetical protein